MASVGMAKARRPAFIAKRIRLGTTTISGIWRITFVLGSFSRISARRRDRRCRTRTAIRSAFENWLFQHNGSVPQFGKLKRQLMFDVDPDLFPSIGGSTDSETLFFLALTFGLRDDPPAALARTMGHVERAREAAGIEQPIQFSACTTDGSRLWTVRYSSNNQSRTQYHSRHIHALRDIHGSYEPIPDGAVILLSEPLDELSEHWEAVPESSLLVVEDGTTTVSSFSPE